MAEHDNISKYNSDENINKCLTNICDLFNRDGIYGEQKLVILYEKNSLSNINKIINLYPYIIYQ